MIVVVGNPSLRPERDGASADGLPARIARAAASAGAAVELIGKVGDDPAGDALLIDLNRAGVGHAALLRDPANATAVLAPALDGGDDGSVPEPEDLLDAAGLLAGAEAAEAESTAAVAANPAGLAPPLPAGPALEAADIELGLRYLVEFRVVVAADPLDEEAATVVADAAAYTGAHLIALVPAGSTPPLSLGGATVLEIPPADPDGAFAGFVASYAAALDLGDDPAIAFRAAAEAGGWEAAPA